MNDNEDLYKSEQPGYQGFISLIIRGALVRSQLVHIENQLLTRISSGWFFVGASFGPGFE